MFENVFSLLSDIGIYVFAISGGIVAIRQEIDLLGVVFISIITAVGGGTIRDICLDVPIFWLENPQDIWIALFGGLSAFLLYNLWSKIRLLVWMDAIGLSVFVAIGASKAMDLGHGFLVTVTMGVLTAVAGGLLRDIVCGDKNLLLREEIYASAAILGSVVLWVSISLGWENDLSLILASIVTFIIRAIGILFNLKLPKRSIF